MSDIANTTNGTDKLRTELDALARDQEHLYRQLLNAREHITQHESDVQNALREFRANPSPHAPVPASPQSDQQRVTNKYLHYQQLIGQIRQVIYDSVPPGVTLLVVSRGDEDLVKLEGYTGWHFPRGADGRYAGFYPKDSVAAIEHLEALRAAGGGYLVFPQTAFWWLDHYDDFKQHLEKNYRVLVRRAEACLVFELSAPSVTNRPSPRRAVRKGRKTTASGNGNGKHKC
jgi:hypothetical protein